MDNFSGKKEVCGYDLIREGEEIIMRINCDTCTRSPSIENNPICMARTVDKLLESGPVTKIVFHQNRDYEYDYSQTQLLIELANLYNTLMKKKDLFALQGLTVPNCNTCGNQRYNEIQNILYKDFKTDPIGAFVQIKRLIRKERTNLEKNIDPKCVPCYNKYIQLLTYLKSQMENTKLILIASPYIEGYNLGSREAYQRIFHPIIKPDFMFTKLMANYPDEAEELDNYTVGESTEISIFAEPDNIQYLYHMSPPEFKLSEEKYEILDVARRILAEHKPKKQEFVDPERMREVFYNVGKDLIEELAKNKNIPIRAKEIEELTKILIRYTVGFGLIEVLLRDEKIQDISINSPQGAIPIFIVHQDYGDCITNIIPTKPEAESWASKLRMISGRPLDEANPILDTELELPGASTRVSCITQPLNPTGLAFSYRRHRDKPWTMPLFMKLKTMNAIAAGVLSFIIDGTRSILICGTRSSGKSSILSSVIVEIMRRYRIITIEDTLELPTKSFRRLGFNIQPMKVASSLTRSSSEMTAADGIRSTLRLGDSALIVGEVRSSEAVALYEAMRVGAAANVVAGTIHGDSPYGIYDRVVNDIGVPKTSFKATDIIVIANPIKSADGLHKYRRVLQITEVRKDWETDPLAENAFVDLLKYNAKTDELEPTEALLNGDSEILKTIAGNISDFVGNWDSVWENILLRSKIKQKQVDIAAEENNGDLLEAPFTIKCADAFHKITEKVKTETGTIDTEKIYFEWEEWLKKEIKREKEKLI